ncbi:unnamed protein product [Lasius platythorax]|uniref:Uncharacterized protein n=1 Tax=Lasius platythorax TaxID=488582 RepID=A0AAV2MWZ9_9HYME
MVRDASEILVGHHDEFEIARQSWEIGMDPVVDQMILETQIQKADSIPFEPKVITVPESGWKTRVLTLFPNYTLTTGDLIRKQLWPLLEGEEWLDLDKVPSREKFNRMLGLTHDRAGKLVSSDLSNATDFILHLYAQALWAGLLHHLEAPAWVRRYVSKMFSPMKILGTNRYILRGIQMGIQYCESDEFRMTFLNEGSFRVDKGNSEGEV